LKTLKLLPELRLVLATPRVYPWRILFSTGRLTVTTFLVFLVIIIALILYGVGIYNALVNLRNRVRNAFAQIDVQLTRRYDLIPNLVEAVKGYMKHERETLDAVISARNSAVSNLEAAKLDPSNADAIKKLGAAEGLLGGALGRLFALSEAYPDLKANQNMMQFQEELASTENKVAFSRQAFNDAVLSYNNKAENFPNNFIAGMFRFELASFLEIQSEDKREVPDVQFT
jgi:LemA protein